MKQLASITALILSACAYASTGVVEASPDVVYDDAAVSREFVRTTGYFCGNGDPVGSSLKWILNTCCEGDTNRYLRVAKETAASNTNFSYMAIALIEKHGSVGDLPFLYRYTNDVRCAGAAIEVILQLGGLTEESVAAASAYITSTNDYFFVDQGDVAEELFRAAADPSAPSDLRAVASSNALHFASNSSGGDLEYNDIGFKNADPSYEYSKRRLGVLRAVLPRCRTDNTISYATNAINELVAYPESDLPD